MAEVSSAGASRHSQKGAERKAAIALTSQAAGLDGVAAPLSRAIYRIELAFRGRRAVLGKRTARRSLGLGTGPLGTRPNSGLGVLFGRRGVVARGVVALREGHGAALPVRFGSRARVVTRQCRLGQGQPGASARWESRDNRRALYGFQCRDAASPATAQRNSQIAGVRLTSELSDWAGWTTISANCG